MSVSEDLILQEVFLSFLTQEKNPNKSTISSFFLNSGEKPKSAPRNFFFEAFSGNKNLQDYYLPSQTMKNKQKEKEKKTKNKKKERRKKISVEKAKILDNFS